jgi:chromosomal replication initiation ATPase DnaA
MGFQSTSFLTTSWVLGQFARTESTAREKFAEFVVRGAGEGTRADLYAGEYGSRILGDDQFAEKVFSNTPTAKKPPLDKVIRYVCEQSGVTERDLCCPSRQRKLAELRGIIGWLTVRLESTTLSDVAKHFNRDLATISRAVRNIEVRQLESKELRERVESSLRYLAK